MQHARALPGPESSRADVLPFEARLACVKEPHDGVRDVVPPVLATCVSTREDEQGWSVLDDDAPDVPRLRNRARPASLFDLEA
jgi:hypothetical protein